MTDTRCPMDSSSDSLVGSTHRSMTGSALHAVPATAAPSSSEACTTTTASLAGEDKPPPMDFSHLFSGRTSLRMPSKMKEGYKLFQIPGIGNFAGGLPNVRFFPYDTLEAQIAKPARWTPSPNKQESSSNSSGDDSNDRNTADNNGADNTDDDDDEDDEGVLITNGVAAVRLTVDSVSSASAASADDRMAPAHLLVPKTPAAGAPKPTPDKEIDLATALQYGTAEGYPPLLAWVRAFTRENLHPNVPYAGGADVVLTVGSTDGFSKALDLFVDDWLPGRDDVRTRPGMLCEPFIFGNILSQIAPKGVQTVVVRADAEGMCPYGPGGLEDVLANWDDSTGRRPHFMYTVTMGHNPTGVVLGTERRTQLYAICSRFDVIIIEDDPYWYLQFPSAAINEAASRNWATPKKGIAELRRGGADAATAPHPQKSSGFAFLDSLVPSFLNIDVDGRVVRLDTFSKTVAPGCRLGWITAQPAMIERFVRITETSTQQPSGFVQSLISELVRGPLLTDDDVKDASRSLSASASASSRWRSSASKRAAPAAAADDFDGWHVGGWVRWLEGLRGEYERRMNRVCTILDSGAFQLKQGTPVRAADADWGVITKTQLYSFDWPRGGMFIWIRVNFEAHPLWRAPHSDDDTTGSNNKDGSSSSGVLDGAFFQMALNLFLTQKPYLVLISPGSIFSSTDAIGKSIGWAYYRLCFAAEAEEQIDSCSHRLVDGIHKFWRIKRVKDLEAILRNPPVAATTAGDAGMLGNMSTLVGC